MTLPSSSPSSVILRLSQPLSPPPELSSQSIEGAVIGSGVSGDLKEAIDFHPVFCGIPRGTSDCVPWGGGKSLLRLVSTFNGFVTFFGLRFT